MSPLKAWLVRVRVGGGSMGGRAGSAGVGSTSVSWAGGMGLSASGLPLVMHPGLPRGAIANLLFAQSDLR
ncbi:MAG TPA: hypothetical protein VN606_08700, partial [Thermoleophilaceae bacterium]|nr:hypothetical protein [Thermoleophilaceae bacterium]